MKAGVIGLGLIGGSIAQCLSKKSVEVVAMNRTAQPLAAALESGVISAGSTEDFGIFKDCDAVFVCVPVGKIVEYVNKLAPHVGKDCVITDAGSTKGKISRAFANRDDVTFIGGHPMAGSEKFGYSAANDRLFEGAYYILTPRENESEAHIRKLMEFIRLMGATPVTLNADYHDRVAALISHGPHVVAAILVNLIRQNDDANGSMHKLSAGGFKDTTRIASSDATMWQNIALENKDEILAFSREFRERLISFEQSLSAENADEVFNFFAEAKKFRDSFLQR